MEHSVMRKPCRWTAIAALVLAFAADASQAAESPLKGAWRVVERISTGPNGTTTTPQVGLIIFTEKHYSVLAVDTDKTRPVIGDPSKATVDDFRAAWQGWGANSGTYEVNGQQFTKRALASKFPAQMRPEVFEVFDFKIDGNTLLLTLRATENGPSPGRGAVRLVRAE